MIKRAVALLEVAEELHGRGLERLRLLPYFGVPLLGPEDGKPILEEPPGGR